MESENSISTPVSDGVGQAVQRSRPLGRTTGPARRSTKGQWTAEEDAILQKAVQDFKGKNWKKIAERCKNRTDVQCLHRWQKVLNPELVKGPWSKEEDETIIELVKKFGPKKWSTISQYLLGRIGKQCRERWYNHLNPGISKEAWTQEEELTLIRAHQIYGNKWAELTKVLPGRTDNGIKNHWNSSVKKKLDSYIKSGLLEQFAVDPLVPYPNQRPPSSCMPSNGDSGPNYFGEVAEISECSHEDNGAGYSQPAGDLCNGVLHAREEFQLGEASGFRTERSSCSASCTEPYYASLDDILFSVAELTGEAIWSAKFPQETHSFNTTECARSNYQLSSRELPVISSVGIRLESSESPIQSVSANEQHELVNVQFQTSAASVSNANVRANCDVWDNILISDVECCRMVFSETTLGEVSSAVQTENSDAVDAGQGSYLPFHQSDDTQISETERKTISDLHCPPKSGYFETSFCQLLQSDPSVLDIDASTLVFGMEPKHLICHSSEAWEQEFVKGEADGFIDASIAANLCGNDGGGSLDIQEESYLAEPSKLVPVSVFLSDSDTIKPCLAEEKSNEPPEPHDTGALFYEPPRFLSLDVPFVSCDLIQSGSHMQQEYSPLGIRQLMMSSMNCITPFRLWDSPSHDNSPEEMLKSAAKTFKNTPSILKKRSRDLLSPLSNIRGDKKLVFDLTSNLANDFLRLDVMFDGNQTNRLPSETSVQEENQGSPGGDEENLDPSLECQGEKGRGCSSNLSNENENKGSNGCCPKNSAEKVNIDVDFTDKLDSSVSNQILQQPSWFPAEDSIKDLFLLSPDKFGLDKILGPSSRTPRNLYRKVLGTLSEQAFASESSSGNACIVAFSPNRKNHESDSAAATSAPPTSSSTPGEKADRTGTDATENFSMILDTPFKRAIASPSAWKSPWFMNSFMPGPRIDTEISIEDVGYLLSPGNKSYDALGLMKQLSEHSAFAYAGALEVLGAETPESIMKGMNSNGKKANRKRNSSRNDLDRHLDANIVTEQRILDFSECGTPGKRAQNQKSPAAVRNLSSSSYLLKVCR